HPASDQENRPDAAARSDTVEKEHGFRALAQHGNTADDCQNVEGTRAGDDSLANDPSRSRELTPVARHPYDVPTEHSDREQQDRCVDYFAADPRCARCDRCSENSDQSRTDDAARDSASDPAATTGCAAAGGQNDADDQCGLEDLAKHDDGCG